jgi:hypothetical protein
MFKVTQEVSEEFVKTQLCNAFEGGSNYWAKNIDYCLPKGIDISEFREGGVRQGDKYWHWSQLIPLVEGCEVLIEDDVQRHEMQSDDYVLSLDREKIQRGLQVMNDKFPEHWNSAHDGGGDGWTGDVFLQCCLFGDVIYG